MVLVLKIVLTEWTNQGEESADINNSGESADINDSGRERQS